SHLGHRRSYTDDGRPGHCRFGSLRHSCRLHSLSHRFSGAKHPRSVTLVPFVLPTVVVGVAFRALLGAEGPLGFLGLDQTTAAVIVAMVFFNISLIARQVGGLWQMLDPRTVEAARSL